jgi:hypothetical protein
MQTMRNEILRVLNSWPTRVDVSGRPLVLNLITANWWATGPVDSDVIRAHDALLRATQSLNAVCK